MQEKCAGSRGNEKKEKGRLDLPLMKSSKLTSSFSVPGREKGIAHPDQKPQKNSPEYQTVPNKLLLDREKVLIFHLLKFFRQLRFFSHMTSY